jgi:hypothetical protein
MEYLFIDDNLANPDLSDSGHEWLNPLQVT